MDLGSPIPYDPFGWRLATLRAAGTSPERRRQLDEELLIWRAELIAHGR